MGLYIPHYCHIVKCSKQKSPDFRRGTFFLPTLLQLLHEVWEQGHESRTLDGVRELALVPLTHAGALARHDLPEGRNVSAERIRIFVINRYRIHAAEMTLLMFNWFLGHNGGSRGSGHLIRS